MRILYVAPLLPSSSGSGGKRALFNHLQDIQLSEVDVDLIVVDVDESRERVPEVFRSMQIQIFPRGLPLGGSVKGKLSGLWQLAFDKRPRAAAVIASSGARDAIRTCLIRQPDVVILEHLNAWSLVEGLMDGTPLHYVAQNVESIVIRDQLENAGRSFGERVRLKIELVKTICFEKALLRRADQITVISARDATSPLLRSVAHKVRVWPELPLPRMARWDISGTDSLLFVGSASYFPNRDALEWLAQSLMPALARLAPHVQLRVAGTNREQMSNVDLPSNIIFEGFVSDERLEALHRSCALFVCPVVQGSGIKIKLLEASAYGMPVAATAESLSGIDYLQQAAFIFRRDDPVGVAASLLELLNAPLERARLGDLGLARLQAAREARGPLLSGLPVRLRDA